MLIKGLIEEDFINYKKPTLTIEMPYCSFKCDKDCGLQVCQNSALANLPNINISTDKLIDRYINNPITRAICFQGLEPFDSSDELFDFIYKFTGKSNDDIVIYTGYSEDELHWTVIDLLNIIKDNKLIIKYGRFIPNQEQHYDEILGVNLASDNQYAKIY